MKKRFVAIHTHSVHTQDAARNVLPGLQQTTYAYVVSQYANAILQARAKGARETGRVRLFVEEHHKVEVMKALSDAFTEQVLAEVAPQEENGNG